VDVSAAYFVSWVSLFVLAGVLVLAMVLVAWAAYTLGAPRIPTLVEDSDGQMRMQIKDQYPRRPLAYPKNAKHPRHSRKAVEQQERVRLVGPYVVAFENEQARRYG
jgi:hypothetical protein